MYQNLFEKNPFFGEYGFDVIHWTLASNTLADPPTDWESKNGRSRDHSSCYNATTRENWVKPYLNATSAPLDTI